jgi:superfamily II DNA or RNA helicase
MIRTAKRELWVPRKYQKKAGKWLVSRPEGALFMDPGLGKTSVVAAAYQALYKRGFVEKALIIAPLRVCYMVWTHDEGGELAKWKNFEDISVSLIHGPDKEEAFEEDADFYVTNFDTLQWLAKEKRFQDLRSRGVNLAVIDELSAFKHARTKRFKTFAPHAAKFEYRWGLTGSPASNGLIDLFGQIKVIDGGKRLGKYITNYRRNYFIPTGYKGYVFKLQEGAEKRIYKQLSDFALPMKATDHLDLPTLVEQNIYVNLPKKVARIYNELEEDLISMFEEGTITASSGGVAAGKCRQVASGGIYEEDDSGRPVMELGTRKTLQLHTGKTVSIHWWQEQ